MKNFKISKNDATGFWAAAEIAGAYTPVHHQEYSSKEQKIFNEFRVWLQEEQKRVQALKIVIPNSLKAIYDEVSQFGK